MTKKNEYTVVIEAQQAYTYDAFALVNSFQEANSGVLLLSLTINLV
jgi:hypothetical protein